jgi:hypothetical protein
LIDIAHRNLITSQAHGGGAKDWCSLVAGPRVAAGLPPFADGKPNEESRVQADGGVKHLQNF